MQIAFFEVVDYLPLCDPVPGMFTKSSNHSLIRLNTTQAVSLLQTASVHKYHLHGEPERHQLQDAFAQWINQYGSFGLDFATIGEDFNKLGDHVSLGFRCLPAFVDLMARQAFKRIGITPQSYNSVLAKGTEAHPFLERMFGDRFRLRKLFATTKLQPDEDVEEVQAAELLEPSRFSLLSDLLSGEWKDAILSRDPNARPLLEANVTWLRSLESHLQEAAATSKRHGARYNRRYHLRTIIKAVSLGALLTGDKNIEEAVRHALDMICSVELATMYKDMLQDSSSLVKIPSPATISRSRLMVDTGFMLYMRSLNRVPSSRFGMSDSSPQLRRDWYMMWQCSIPNDALKALLDSTHYLFETKGSGALDRAAHFLKIIGNVDIHTCVPATLAWRRASLLHKMHAMVHAFYLETGEGIDGVLRHLRSFFSWTTDQGVESLQADIQFLKVKDLLDWLPDQNEVSVKDAHALDLPDDNDTAEAAPEPPPPPSLQEQVYDQYLMPNTLWVPGLLHILHGATESLLSIFNYWEDEVKLLVMALIDFFAKGYQREAFVALCLRRRPAGNTYEYLFKTFAAKVIECRWGSLLEALSEVITYEVALVQFWDASEMKKEFGERKKDKESADAVPKVTEAITSAFMWAYIHMLLLLGEVIRTMRALGESCFCHSA